MGTRRPHAGQDRACDGARSRPVRDSAYNGRISPGRPPMNHADAFVQDVVANPHDDAPRLIYADWLLDQDEPGTRARAELIRVQYALEGLAVGAPRRAPLEQRERDVLLAHQQEWTKGLEEHGVHESRFRRGFVESVRITPQRLLEEGEALRSMVPLRELDLT